MSYDLGLKDPATDEWMVLDLPHQMKGGTYQVGGTPTAEINITYNYSKHFLRVLGVVESNHPESRDGKLDGIRTLYGMTGAESVALLKRGIEQLGDELGESYWDDTEGNAKQALRQCLALAQLRPDGVWDGD